jgi:hypothetical protein
VSWPRLLVAAALAAAVGWALVTSWGGVVHSHLAYAGVLALAVVVGALFGLGRPAPGRLRWLRYSAAGVAAASLLAVVVLGRPSTAAFTAVEAMRGTPAVSVDEDLTAIVIRPRSPRPDAVGLAFDPGALIDPRAYTPLLLPVAAAGHPVVIVKAPLGIALLSPDLLDAARDRMPRTTTWAVGGHSLGGATASGDIRRGPDAPAGLVLWASYPIRSIRDSAAPVLTVSGSRDGLTTADDIAASGQDLPRDATFVEVAGANHATFGDYGTQRGDRPPTGDRAAAQRRISDATTRFLDSLAR